ncbi:hypothetical protein RAM_29535 [Amycolatopsis mediterranei S699]|uniref:Uncharacterized protein n=1 Tax=Amycolatopsis mediterranei (strain S699) TaxID=713604 RepID=A0A9R0P142_AMYMS|nr:hypothetical protein RAM_29535 [Amycolatopsis mediterranei S699]
MVTRDHRLLRGVADKNMAHLQGVRVARAAAAELATAAR